MTQRERGQGRELEAIRAIARTRRTDDLAGVCDDMQRIAAASTDSERVAIYLFDAPARQLVMATTPFGYDGCLAERHRRASIDTPIWGDVVNTLTPLVFSAASLPEANRAAVIGAGFAEFAIIPLHADGSLIGTLNLARTRPEPYAPETVQLALALGDQISAQIERARLYIEEKQRGQSLERLNADLRRSYEELALAQSELLRKERLASLGELAVLVAHEVRNPLGVVFNVVSQLRRLIPGDVREARQLLGILDQEAARLDRIVKDFLDFGRPASPQSKPIDVAPLVDSAIELTTLALEGARVSWSVDIPADASRLEADEHLLRQALVNLFVNAAEAQALDGTVGVKTVACRVDGRDHLRLSIANGGPAVGRGLLERAFDPFFTTKASGTGLGLTIVRRIVEAHAGQVTIEPLDGGGAVVTLTLPLRACPPARADPAAS
ncbi:MAG TPA: ATP-binding protein [Polyangiaceae bacterium]|nr:ATP-binding protein [Polyangiaceae bacterium]